MEQDFRAVVLHGFSQEEALSIMRAVKALGLPGSQPAFATSTPNKIGWSLSELFEHLEEEHRQMLAWQQSRREKSAERPAD